jgi:hypothetical protein
MEENEREYLESLRKHEAETRTLLSNAQKPERERMVVRAFLRCIGEAFLDAEIKASTTEPVDTLYRDASFQVRDILGKRKRGVDLAARQERYQKAQSISDVRDPWTSSQPMSFAEVSAEIAEALRDKASHYGPRGCAKLDALVYVDLHGRHLWPLDPQPDPQAAKDLHDQGWRSVSFVFLPYGVVLAVQSSAPAFLKERVGRILREWPGPDGWFEA